MKKIVTICFIGFVNLFNAQIQSPDCATAEAVCSANGSSFPLSTGQGSVQDLPAGNNISNPSTNPQGVNSGCLFSNELNPNWFVINVGTSGALEFTIGSAGGSGFYDWAMWPYDPNACAGIQGNTVAPAACNWNASSSGFTGMWNGGVPPGGNSGNFQPALNVVAGQQFVLMFSNYSGLSGNTQLSFPVNPGSAGVNCTSSTPDQTICQGTSAVVNLIINPAITNPSVNWLVTTNVSNTSGMSNVLVNPSVTTLYQVQVLESGNPIDTIEFTVNVVPPPMPNAGLDDTVCFGQPIFLNGTLSSPSNTSTWQFLTTGITPTPVVTFAPNFSSLTPTVTVNQTGLYQFILRETNSVCGIRRDTVRVLVSQITQTTSSVSPSCYGFSDGEIHINSPAASEYSFNNGATWQVDSFALVFSAGTYSVCSRNSDGCQVCSNVSVTNPALVTISMSNDTLICENGTAQLMASATGGSSYLYNWNHTSNTQNIQSVSPLVNTTYYAFAENQNGCISATDSILVTIRNPISGLITPDVTICPGYPTTLTASSTGGIGVPFNFNWSSGEVGNGADNTITANPTQNTTYSVTITDQCESTPLILTTNVLVAALPVPQISVDIDNECEPATFVLTNETDTSMVDYVYWEFSDGQIYIDQATVTTDEMWSGLYDVQLIITSPQGCIDSTTFYNYLTVHPKPFADFRHNPNPVLMFNTQVQLTNYSINGESYQWFIESGNPSYSQLRHLKTSFPDGVTGKYNVTLVTTSEFGCVDTATQIVIVLPEVLLYAPNSFTPDGDEYNQSWGVYMEGVDIYDFELLVLNRWGEKVWESHDVTAKWDGTYGGKIIETGIYTWVIRAKDAVNDAKYEYNGFVTILR